MSSPLQSLQEELECLEEVYDAACAYRAMCGHEIAYMGKKRAEIRLWEAVDAMNRLRR